MKTNYYKSSLEEIERIKTSSNKPRLLLHACCAPCACFPLDFLSSIFTITILYNNSNIYPAEEYQRRLDELERYLKHFNALQDDPVSLVVPSYDNVAYTEKLKPLKDEPERGKRCHLCYRLRMREGFEYARQHDFDYYTTVMTISRQKDSQVLNQIGAELEVIYPTVRYFYSDFKKADGILKANQLIQENKLYRQNYCGCLYSFNKRKESD